MVLDIKTTESANPDDELFDSAYPRDRYIYALDPKDGPERVDLERNTYEDQDDGTIVTAPTASASDHPETSVVLWRK